MNKYITKVRKNEKRITHVYTDIWESIESVIQNIESTKYTYYVKVETKNLELEVETITVDNQTRKYLRTKPDGIKLDNLSELPYEYKK